MKKIIVCIALFCVTPLFAKPEQKISLDLQNARLIDALHMMAVQLHENWIINPAINSQVTLHLTQVAANKTLAVLLQSYNLVKVSLGDAWYITLRNDWMQRTQDNLKLSDAIEASAPLVTRVFQIHYAKAEDIARLLQERTDSFLSKRGHVHVDVRTNIICVQDVSERLNQVQQLINKTDIPVQQVLIETRLANVDSDFERDLGINFAVTQTDNPNKVFGKTPYSLLVAKLADGSLLDMQLIALENQGRAELISSPRLFTANQQTAAIESGEEIPYQEESSSGGTIVRFKKAVLSLKVTPQVLPNNKVLLQLQVNQDRPSKLLIQGVPAINTRQISTNVLLKDGQTVVLGGIYESDKEHVAQSIPYLSKIPLLGLLMQQNETRINKRELLIFVTPKIVPS